MQEMQETQVQFLGQEDTLEKEMASHSSILVQRIPWTEEPRRLWLIGAQRAGHNWAHKHAQLIYSSWKTWMKYWHVSDMNVENILSERSHTEKFTWIRLILCVLIPSRLWKWGKVQEHFKKNKTGWEWEKIFSCSEASGESGSGPEEFIIEGENHNDFSFVN